ncbi:helix-turn-helix domain-containing protein [Microbacterium sp. dk485]|uniref:TetR/AcrR family transcriptional regulator n=1 Tax=Microbacterium sp. dk485 TaxID=2560021 RepID=UPI001ADDC861|nr:helix-turn-helix domain-containing protein [Microbacterium sp. dk485]
MDAEVEMRSDAAKRRATILHEARRLFAEHGGSVALEAIAEASGVGIATLYRNFATRAELADAVALDILADIRAAAGAGLAVVDDAATAAWDDFLTRLVGLELGALADALALRAPAELTAAVRQAQDDALGEVAALLAAARARGIVRAELDPVELVLAIGVITRPQPAALQARAPHLTARLAAIFAAGLRA